MIEASFDAQRERGTAVSGAYQYDTGQRLRMHGLPSPQELASRDDFLSGDEVVVQAQYSFIGDSQTEMRLASYDEENNVWTADIPDAYLTRYAPVHVYIYVTYGENEAESRAKTYYEATFTPISRPAPSDAVTPDQANAWDVLVKEVNLTLSAMNTAISEANAAANGATTAAGQASTAAASAQAAGNAWQNAVVEVTTLEPGSKATVTVTEKNGVKHLIYGIPRGADGATGPEGPRGPRGPRVNRGRRVCSSD